MRICPVCAQYYRCNDCAQHSPKLTRDLQRWRGRGRYKLRFHNISTGLAASANRAHNTSLHQDPIHQLGMDRVILIELAGR
jgi:hypothetical protein